MHNKSCLFLGTKEAIFAFFFFKKGIFEWLLLGLHSKSNVVFQIRPYSWPIFHLQCCTHNQIGYSPRYALITFLLGHILHCTLKPQNARKNERNSRQHDFGCILLLLFVLGFSKEIALKGPKIVRRTSQWLKKVELSLTKQKTFFLYFSSLRLRCLVLNSQRDFIGQGFLKHFCCLRLMPTMSIFCNFIFKRPVFLGYYGRANDV